MYDVMNMTYSVKHNVKSSIDKLQNNNPVYVYLYVFVSLC